MSEPCQVFEAWVECDGERLPEFDHPEPTPLDMQFTAEVNYTSCWIASKANKTFSVKWRYAGDLSLLDRPVQTQGHLYIDGIYITSRVSDGLGGITTIDSAAVGDYQRRRLKFQKIMPPGPDDLDVPHLVSGKFGTIELCLRRIVSCVVVPVPPGTSLQRSYISSCTPIHKCSTLARFHCVALGDLVNDAKKECLMKGTTLDIIPWGDGYTIFRFHYRPLEVLQRLRISPPAIPSQQPTTVSPPSLTSNDLNSMFHNMTIPGCKIDDYDDSDTIEDSDGSDTDTIEIQEILRSESPAAEDILSKACKERTKRALITYKKEEERLE